MNLEDLPQLPREKWPPDGDLAWRSAESLVIKFYPFKCRAACESNRVESKPGWMNNTTGLTAAELGVPVHQALWVVSMRTKREVS
jgi:hypothetical protein